MKSGTCETVVHFTEEYIHVLRRYNDMRGNEQQQIQKRGDGGETPRVGVGGEMAQGRSG